jgi:branched-subunit amino acid aminotransferase/4-amino-4-deoxychorismate lyase
VASRARRPPTLDRLTEALARRTAVVHGRGDTTVPVADSQALVEGTGATLVLVDDDHRLTTTATPEQFQKWLALVCP